MKQVTVKLSLFLIKHYVVEAYGGVECDVRIACIVLPLLLALPLSPSPGPPLLFSPSSLTLLRLESLPRC
jgi:hypothetical protein